MKDLSFLRDLNDEQRVELLRLLKQTTQREARVATSESEATTQERGSGGHAPATPLTSLDELSFDHNLLSHDRQCLRATLEEWAFAQSRDGLPSAPDYAELHKWWDATAYSIRNDWLFTDEQFLSIELINADGAKKEFRLRVSY